MHRFLLADDHSIVRSGIKMLIRSNFEVQYIHEAANSKELDALGGHHPYDLILLDVNIPGIDFTSTMAWLQRVNPQAAVLVFSGYSNEIYGIRSIRKGAGGYLQKSASDEEIVTAMGQLLDGGRYLSPMLADVLLRRDEALSGKNPFEALTDREMAVAAYLEQGMPLGEIGKHLNLEYSTCSTYKRRVFDKLKIASVSALSKLMQAYGLVQ